MILKRASQFETADTGGIPPSDFVQTWMEWTPWTQCSITCGEGAKLRTRECTMSATCSGPYYEYTPCHNPPCPVATGGYRDTKSWAIGIMVLLNLSMVFCILAPFLIKKMKKSKSDTPRKSQPEREGRPKTPPLYTPIEEDAPSEETTQTSEPSTEHHMPVIFPPAGNQSPPTRPVPSPRNGYSEPNMISSSPREQGRRPRSYESRETYGSTQTDESSFPDFRSTESNETPSFFVMADKSKQNKKRIVDIDLDATYDYRPTILEGEGNYQYRPVFNDNQHCNGQEYRVERLATIPDTYRPSVIVDCERFAYRPSGITDCKTCVYRIAIYEEPAKEGYRWPLERAGDIAYRASEELVADVKTIDERKSSETTRPVERKCRNPSLELFYNFEKTDMHGSAGTTGGLKNHLKQMVETSVKDKLKKFVRNTECPWRKNPAKEPLLGNLLKEKHAHMMERTLSPISSGEDKSTHLNSLDDFHRPSVVDKKPAQKNVSFAPSSQIKYIETSSETESSKSASASSYELFHGSLKAPTETPSDSEESTLFVNNSHANNSNRDIKRKKKHSYGSFLRNFFFKNYNNSSKTSQEQEIYFSDNPCDSDRQTTYQGVENSRQPDDRLGQPIVEATPRLEKRPDSTKPSPDLPLADGLGAKVTGTTHPVCRLNEKEKSLIKKRRKLLWSSSEAESFVRSDCNSNDSLS